jgi:hypothetical protein
MREDMTIGTKVRITFDNETMSEKDYTITAIKNYKEVDDWCDHFIVKDECGEEKEIREYECVFPPKEFDREDAKIYHFLSDNGVWGEVYKHFDLPIMVVDISWGDWKHEHGWCKCLMKYLGYGEIGCKVTEEDGSDTYSAEHYFIKVA